ncbi:MAG: ATP phosphoribosyltransferase regulatory subunit [Planctomycetota bacterium]
MAKGKFKTPRGTRDLYPEDLLRQRYIADAWRRVSIRHGFDEIAGPTFEHLDLYKVKSGDGIVSELFSFRRDGGDDDYALRPEFTPTLARLYAARAASLPTPTKWFTAGPYFRAERPQRGRLREFLQWNCDVIGDDSDGATADLLAVCVGVLDELGLNSATVQAEIGSRRFLTGWCERCGIGQDLVAAVCWMLDNIAKLPAEALARAAAERGLTPEQASAVGAMREQVVAWQNDPAWTESDVLEGWPDGFAQAVADVFEAGDARGITDRLFPSPLIARGLAYYTGTVFELVADGERAVAGGGRYDDLIELFGGPPTPAVGFGMGDVVLRILLEDKDLMPEGAPLRESLSQPSPSLRPKAFVIADEEDAALIEPLLASLRRGIESPQHESHRPWSADRFALAPMHARRSYRGKRKKQLQDASAQHAQFAVIVNEPNKVELRDLDNPRDELTPNLIDAFSASARGTFADFSADPDSPVYVGKAIDSLLG